MLNDEDVSFLLHAGNLITRRAIALRSCPKLPFAHLAPTDFQSQCTQRTLTCRQPFFSPGSADERVKANSWR